jgi:hypothetical protein
MMASGAALARARGKLSGGGERPAAGTCGCRFLRRDGVGAQEAEELEAGDRRETCVELGGRELGSCAAARKTTSNRREGTAE